ncbi:hypothetical protein TNCV_4143971 [Trichonephila clavipes]|nr:hypothetical protein TNCV_4143971 [Trichonephila clavipes]
MAKGKVSPVVSRSFEHLTCDRTILAQFHPNFEGEHSGGDQGTSTSPPIPPTSREHLRLDGYLEYLLLLNKQKRIFFISEHLRLSIVLSLARHHCKWSIFVVGSTVVLADAMNASS